MMAALPEEGYTTRDILIDRDGTWHLRGMPVPPMRSLSQVDVVLNALHGGIGEDGTVQRILDRAGVPYAGSRALSSSLALNKIRAREVLQRAGLPMPRAVSFHLDNRMDVRDMADAVFQQFGPPYVVKPPMEGSSKGLRVASTFVELPGRIADALNEYRAVLIEEYVIGAHATVGIIEHFRNEDVYVLPPAHIVLPKDARYFDPYADGESLARHVVPSRFSQETKRAIADMARKAHRALKLAHFSDADLVITRAGRPYLLEMNALPHLHGEAAFPRMLEAVGSSVREFLEHVISLARRGG